MKIPKVINYCWFGGKEMPESAIECINSWKKYCPDYEIVRWDETNFDVNKYKFTKEAYEQKKWAFVTDVARLDIIYNNGGIYFDTDVQLVKNIDDLLDQQCFMGFECDEFVANGLGFGAVKNNKIIYENLKMYNNLSFKDNKNLSEIACPIITSAILEKKGFIMNGKLQTIDGCTLYPKDYFCPMSYDTGIITMTKNTYSIHLYNASWKNEKELARHKIEMKINSILIKFMSIKSANFISRKVSKILCVFFCK